MQEKLVVEGERYIGKFTADRTVNGIDVGVDLDERQGGYVININHGQIPLSSKDRGVAKRVFDYAYQIAGTESNPDAVFKKVEEFSRNLS